MCADGTSAKVQCPCCRNTDHTMMVDKRTRGIVLGLTVKCTMTDCCWAGELINLHHHQQHKCPLSIGEYMCEDVRCGY